MYFREPINIMEYQRGFPHGGPTKYFQVSEDFEIGQLERPIGITQSPNSKNIVIGGAKRDQVHIFSPQGM